MAEMRFPDDCSRDEDQGTGKLLLTGNFCEESQQGRRAERFQRAPVLVLLARRDGSVRNAKWDWFNARNCRKRCMDLVSFETKRNTTGSRDHQCECSIFFGPPVVCDMMGVTDRTLPKNIADGLVLKPGQAGAHRQQERLHDWSRHGGFSPAPSPNPTTGSRHSLAASPSLVWRCSITSRRWNLVARCGLSQEAHHLRGCLRSSAFARQTFPNIRIP